MTPLVATVIAVVVTVTVIAAIVFVWVLHGGLKALRQADADDTAEADWDEFCASHAEPITPLRQRQIEAFIRSNHPSARAAS